MDDVSKACFLAARAPHSGDWINAMPVSSCGLGLDDEAIRVEIGLRMNLCAPPIYAQAEVWWTPVVYMAYAARGALAARSGTTR